MNRMLDLFRLVPRSGKILSLAFIIGAAVYAVYSKWGLQPAIFLASGILLIYLLVFLYNKVIKASERQSGAAFGKALNASQIGASKEEVRSAVGALGQKWREAVENFRRANLDLYTLPWYMLIGEPQSGKSTTLKFSGMKFPLGMEAISGGGGTRNCDWWFTEHGIILDTAGRFTFQEESATDAAEWNHFLGLLANHRPYCPINGILLVVPATSLLSDPSHVRMAKAKNISEKLHHIQQKLAIQFPVFVLLTKCDTVYGFTEFFNKLNVDQQREMFGWSNPVLEDGFNLATFDQSFQALVGRVDQIRLRNLSRPHYSDDANKTFIFPEEFNALYQPLREYMSVIFESSIYRASLFFRGYYFTSGMQEGKPIASACKALLQKGVVIPDLEKVFSKSRAFFIRDFYTEKVFPEEGLVQRAYHHVKRDRLKKRLILGLNIGLLALGALFVTLMYRSLNRRLDEPKRAIDQSLTIFQTMEGSFFDTPRDREAVFTNLMQLKGAIEDGRKGSFLLFFKGSENELTRKLQDTFSYLFLDKVLDGLFARVEKQLAEFRVDHPGQPRQSQAELDALLASFKEASEWRYQVKKGSERDFEPSITPFLKLSLDAQWDQELAAHRGDQTIAQRLDSWFSEVYRGSSPQVRSAVIATLVSRMERIYPELHLKIGRFYREQPEMKRYLAKRALQTELDLAYDACQMPGLGAEPYHERLSAIQPFFSPENQAIMAPEGDQYLTLEAIRQATLEAHGSAFSSLARPEENVSGKERNRRELLPDVVTFSNQLLALRSSDYPDPRAESSPRDEQPVSYSGETRSFWDNLVEPYFQQFLAKGREMEDLPRAGEGRSKNLERLFITGSERASLNKEIFRNNAFKHTALVADERKRVRFEEALDEYFKALQLRNQEVVLTALEKILDDLAVKAPGTNQWQGLVREFRSLTRDGADFESFLRGPAAFQEELRTSFRREVTNIFPEKDDLFELLKTYLNSAQGNLKNFSASLDELDAIPSSELATRRDFYRGRIREKEGLERLTQLQPENWRVMSRHRESLEAWARAALDAWAAKVGGADPCPECRQDIDEILRLYQRMNGSFPVEWKGIVQTQEKTAGAHALQVRCAAVSDLDTLLAAIERFRNASGMRAEYLRSRGYDSFFADAFLWADFVRALRSGQISLSYKLQPDPGASDPMIKYFAFSDLSGFYQAKRLSFNSPSFRTIERNPNADPAEGLSALFTLLNDTEGNRSESKLAVRGSELELFGFVLADATVVGSVDSIDKSIAFPLNYGNRDVSGLFRFKFSQPVAPPPNWSRLRR